MIRRPLTLLAAMVLAGALFAGCGSSGATTTSSSTPATAASSSAPAGTAGAPATPTITAPGAGGIGVAEAVSVCKSLIARDPSLSAAIKAKVEGICNKAAHGDLAGARAAAKEVCAEVINSSPIPAAAKQQALAGCKRA